jgi:hypothetical protein
MENKNNNNNNNNFFDIENNEIQNNQQQTNSNKNEIDFDLTPNNQNQNILPSINNTLNDISEISKLNNTNNTINNTNNNNNNSGVNINTLDINKKYNECSNPLEFFIISLCKNMNISIKQSIALLSNNRKYLKILCYKGIKKNFEKVIFWLNDVLNNINLLINLLKSDSENNNKNILMTYATIGIGLNTKNFEVCEYTIKILSYLIIEIGDNNNNFDWIKNEGFNYFNFALFKYLNIKRSIIQCLFFFIKNNFNEFINFLLNRNEIDFLFEIIPFLNDDEYINVFIDNFINNFINTVININNNNNFINESNIKLTSKSVDKKLKNFNKKKSSSKKIITISQNNNNFDNYMNNNYAIFDEIFQSKVEDLNLFKKKPKHILKSKSESNKKIFFDNFSNEKKNKLKNDYLKKNNKTNFIFAPNFNFFSPQNAKKNVKYLKNNINYINKKNKNKIINTSKSSRNFEKNKENKKKLISPFLINNNNKKEKFLNDNSKCSTKSNSYKNKILSSYRNYYSNDSKINLNDYQIENMFIKIFKLLDKDNDNKINILNMDIKNIPTSIYNLIISSIINKLKIRNNEINLKDFCEIGINKFKYFPIKKKKILINFINNL